MASPATSAAASAAAQTPASRRPFAKDARVLVLGARGMVGSALVRLLAKQGFANVLAPSRQELDLSRQADVQRWFAAQKPEFVFVAAARVGGIVGNMRDPAGFLYDNATIATNSIHAAAEVGVEKLLFLGSSCIYPKFAPQPIKESALLEGPLEPTNEGYALGKIVGLKLCEYYNRQFGRRFIAAMPTNLYGPGDNFHPENSHVVPGMLRRFHEALTNGASEVQIWGTGTPRREFLHVDDLARALLHLMECYEEPGLINVGSGEELSILALAQLVASTVGFCGQIICDPTRPDGTPRKLLDSSRLRALGWRPAITLPQGLASTWQWVQATNALASTDSGSAA